MTKSWLHWIGKTYYKDSAVFTAEASHQGVTRRVALHTLKRMEWHDMVCCIQKEGQRKYGSIFLEFPIAKLSGLSAEASVRLSELEEVRINEMELEQPQAVARGCGSYLLAAIWEISGIELSTIGRYLEQWQKEDGMDIGKPMIGCAPYQVTVGIAPLIMLKDVPFRMGFRTIDREKMQIDAFDMISDGKNPILRGQYYEDSDREALDGGGSGRMEIVQGYTKKEDLANSQLTLI